MIKHSPKVLLHILTKLKGLSSELALECLKGAQSDWERLADQLASKGGSIDTKSLEDITRFYDTQVKDIADHKPFEDFVKLSQTAESRSSLYKHDLYQAAITGVIISHNKDVMLAQVPTGSGKSYIIAMLALYYHQVLK